jgi:hypothetical protein
MKGRAGLAGRVSGYAEQPTREGFSPNGVGRLLIPSGTVCRRGAVHSNGRAKDAMACHRRGF